MYKEPFNFLTIDTTFPASDPLRFRKNLFDSYKNDNKRELQNIAINHSADIDFQDFIKIYRECSKEPYNFFWQ